MYECRGMQMVVNILRMFDTRMHMKKKDPANLKELN